MEDLIPNVKLKADVDPKDFLARIELIAGEQGHYEVYRDNAPEVDGGWELLGLRVKGKATHKGLTGQLVATPIDNPHLLVKVLADRWNSDLSYQTYVAAVHEVFDPLVQGYNRKFRARRRLSIPTQESLESTLPTKAGDAFRKFVNLANKSVLHPLDWRRFYQFIKVCHNGRVSATASDIERLLVRAGFAESDAERIAIIYEHGRKMAKIF